MIKTVNSGKFTQATTALCPLVAWWLFYVAHPFIADRMTDFGASRLTVFHNFRNNMESSMTYWSFLTWLDLTWLDSHGMNACISVSTNRGVRMCLLKVSHKAKVASWLDLTSLSLYVKRPFKICSLSSQPATLKDAPTRDMNKFWGYSSVYSSVWLRRHDATYLAHIWT